MPMYNLIEYSDNYADSSGSLWRFKRDEQNMTDAGNPTDVTTDANNGSSSFKGCVCYIFASFFFKSKREHLSN